MQNISSATTGMIFNIQRFSIHDGPGIRTTVFFKGCNLRCLWCHNPESVERAAQILYDPAKCIGCGACAAVCPNNAQRMEDGVHVYLRAECDLCGACLEECFTDALTLSGKPTSVEAVVDEVMRDLEYYRESDGGVTFSGGDPLLQPDFLFDLLSECKRLGLHTAVDTAGNVPWETIERVAPLTDLFLYDIKAVDPEIHRRATGVSNQRILENLRNLVQMGKRVWVRIPTVPGYNASLEEMGAIAAFLEELNGVERIEMMPYHSLGSEKYANLERDYPAAGIPIPRAAEMEALRDLLFARNLPVHIM
ncbi:MAG: glycyl-radical enzyme activating protein [Anaerolineaceae bacterium]|nr:glycyl-radical enzyme activating protein [Anaerolineaceae bacterium]